MTYIDCTDPANRERAVTQAVQTARRHQLVVFPTDSVYAIACDAFSAIGVERLIEAKERVSSAGLPVMVGSIRAGKALMRALPAESEALVNGFWPGSLTIVSAAQPTLNWDLGGRDETVTLRMPVHPLALDILRDVGPMVVVAANKPGESAPLNCADARTQLGDSGYLYLDCGPCQPAPPSTVVDLTDSPPQLLREGELSLETLQTVAPSLLPIPSDT